ncbi:MAG: hypothetical protein IKQ46_18090 [Bacteroidales bacterium]|nr:hypothetical protein [Bacteroidales bacterium]
MGKNEYLSSSSHGGSPWHSVYNDDQKRVLRAYNDSIKDGVYYLFFIDNVTDKKDGNGTMVSGYMPRGYNCGFVYDGGSPHTIAHELGHGIAGLEHVFENSKSSGKTNNLMDYSLGEQLWHFQWDEIQDPSRVWMKWSKDESEGEWISINDMIDSANNSSYHVDLYRTDDNRFVFFTPSGYPIVMPQNVKEVSFLSKYQFVPQGALTFFSTDTEQFVALYGKKENKDYFKGYVQVVGTNPSDLKNYVKQFNGNYVYYVDSAARELAEYDAVTIGYNKLCGVTIVQTSYSDLPQTIKTEVKQQKNYTGSGFCSGGVINYNTFPTSADFSVYDSTNCLTTKAARDFYDEQIQYADLSTISLISRIALKIEEIAKSNSEESKLFDNYYALANQTFGSRNTWNTVDKLHVMEEFLNNLFDIQKIKQKLLSCNQLDELYPLFMAYLSVNGLVDTDLFIHNLQVLAKSDFTEPEYLLYQNGGYLDSDWMINKQRYQMHLINPINNSVLSMERLCSELSSSNLLFNLKNKLEPSNYDFLIESLLSIFYVSRKDEVLGILKACLESTLTGKDYERNAWRMYTLNRTWYDVKGFYYDITWNGDNLRIKESNGYTAFRTLGVFDIVVVKFEKVPDFLEDLIREGESIPMPGFYFEWISNDIDKEHLYNRIKFTLAVVALYFSVESLLVEGFENVGIGVINASFAAADLIGVVQFDKKFMNYLKKNYKKTYIVVTKYNEYMSLLSFGLNTIRGMAYSSGLYKDIGTSDFANRLLRMEDVKTKFVNEYGNIKFVLENLMQDPDFEKKYIIDVQNYINQLSAIVKYIED